MTEVVHGHSGEKHDATCGWTNITAAGCLTPDSGQQNQMLATNNPTPHSKILSTEMPSRPAIKGAHGTRRGAFLLPATAHSRRPSLMQERRNFICSHHLKPGTASETANWRLFDPQSVSNTPEQSQDPKVKSTEAWIP